MSVVTKAEALALSLPESDRARLAEKLLASLSSPFWDDDDDGLGETIRRSREMDEDPDMVMSHEEFMASFEACRGQ